MNVLLLIGGYIIGMLLYEGFEYWRLRRIEKE